MIRCADDGPVKPDGGQVVGDARHLGNIIFAGGSALTGGEVYGFDSAAVGGAVQA